MDDGVASWEQPVFAGLDAIAVDLITAVVQDVFRGLDPHSLVDAGRPDLSKEDRAAVAALIDGAVVELVVDFGGAV